MMMGGGLCAAAARAGVGFEDERVVVVELWELFADGLVWESECGLLVRTVLKSRRRCLGRRCLGRQCESYTATAIVLNDRDVVVVVVVVFGTTLLGQTEKGSGETRPTLLIDPLRLRELLTRKRTKAINRS